MKFIYPRGFKAIDDKYFKENKIHGFNKRGLRFMKSLSKRDEKVDNTQIIINKSLFSFNSVDINIALINISATLTISWLLILQHYFTAN